VATREITRTFKFDRATKNTVRYTEVVEDDQAPVVGTIYIQKHAAQGATEVVITLAFEQE